MEVIMNFLVKYVYIAVNSNFLISLLFTCNCQLLKDLKLYVKLTNIVVKLISLIYFIIYILEGSFTSIVQKVKKYVVVGVRETKE